jgi:cysteinyl-tRNA synthetase
MVEPVTQWLCYSIHYNSNIESMKKQVEKLRDARDRVQHLVDVAIRNGDEIEGDVNNWLEEVDKKMRDEFFWWGMPELEGTASVKP